MLIFYITLALKLFFLNNYAPNINYAKLYATFDLIKSLLLKKCLTFWRYTLHVFEWMPIVVPWCSNIKLATAIIPSLKTFLFFFSERWTKSRGSNVEGIMMKWGWYKRMITQPYHSNILCRPFCILSIRWLPMTDNLPSSPSSVVTVKTDKSPITW